MCFFCSVFKDLSPALSSALCYITTIRFSVNSFLQNFFQLFLFLSLPLRRALYYLFISPL